MRNCALFGLYALLIVACYLDATVGQPVVDQVKIVSDDGAGSGARVTRQIGFGGGYPYGGYGTGYGGYGGGLGGIGYGGYGSGIGNIGYGGYGGYSGYASGIGVGVGLRYPYQSYGNIYGGGLLGSGYGYGRPYGYGYSTGYPYTGVFGSTPFMPYI